MSGRKLHSGGTELLKVVVILSVMILIYIPSFSNSFVWDDDIIIKHNASLRAPSPIWLFGQQFLPKTFSANISSYYRPVSVLWLWLGYRIWGLAPIGYRIENFLLYIITTIALYLVFKKIAGAKTALIATAIFAFHPAHIENVAFPSGITDVSAGMFLILSFLSYLSKSRFLRYILSPLLWMFALLSKEVAVVGIAVIIVYDLMFRWQRETSIWKGWLTWLSALLIYFSARLAVIGTFTQSISSKYPFALRMLFAPYFLIRYIQNAILPIDLRPFHPETIANLSIGTAILFCATLLVLIFLTIKFLQRQRRALFGIIWFVIFLLPVLGIVHISAASWAERFLLISSAGSALAIALLITRLLPLKPAFAPQLSKILVVSYIIFLAATSFIYSFYWRNNWMLSRRMIETSPSLAIGYSGMGKLFIEIGEVDSAAKYITQALERDSIYFPALNIMANIWLIRKDFDSTAYYLRRALRHYPNYTTGYLNMGKCMLETGDTLLAVKYYKQALLLAPRDYNANRNYGLGLILLGDTASGIEFLKRSCKYYPEGMYAPIELVNIYCSIGDTQSARAVLDKFPQIRKTVHFKNDSAQAGTF